MGRLNVGIYWMNDSRWYDRVVMWWTQNSLFKNVVGSNPTTSTLIDWMVEEWQLV